MAPYLNVQPVGPGMELCNDSSQMPVVALLYVNQLNGIAMQKALSPRVTGRAGRPCWGTHIVQITECRR